MRGMLVGVLVVVGCGGDEPPAEDVLGTAADAADAAAALTGGSAGEAEAVTEDGHDLWEVAVEMPNGASLEVVLFRADGALFEIKDTAGPFDYDALDPLPGQLTYAEARAAALEVVDGTQEAWEVAYEGGEHEYYYEFYVRYLGDQLWEVKLWADTGEVFLTEAVEEMD